MTLPFTHDPAGRRYEFRVDVVHPPGYQGRPRTTDTYLCGFVEWRGGALVLNRAAPTAGRLSETGVSDSLIVPIGWPVIGVVTYIGEAE